MKVINRNFYSLFLAFCLLVIVQSPGFCGVVTLKSGKVISGLITKKTEKDITIRVGPDEETYSLSDVESIKGNKPVTTYKNSLEESDRPQGFKDVLKIAASGSFLHAEEGFRKILKDNPYDFNAKEALRAIDDYRKGVINQDYTVFLFKGAYFFLNNDFEKAIKVYKQALEINPGATEIYYNLASSYYFLGNEGEAIIYFEKLAKTDPEDLDVLFNLGSIYHSLEKHKKAIIYFERLLKIFPEDPQSYAFLGTSYYATGQYTKSRKCLKKAKTLLEEMGNTQEATDVAELLKNLP